MKQLGKIGLVALLVLWAAVTLSWPHWRDQGFFSWVGSVIVQGGAPYKDAWEHKGPATYLFAALAQWVFGHNEWGLRLLDLALFLGALTAAFRLAKRLGDAFGAWAAVTILFGLYGRGGYWNTAQADGWFAMLLVVTLAVAVRPDFAARLRWPAAAGLLLGVSVLFKPLFGLYAVPLAVFLLARAQWRWRRAAAPLAAMGGAFAVPVAAVLAWLASRGALGAFFEVQFEYNPTVYAAAIHRTFAGHIAALGQFFFDETPLMAAMPLFVLGLAGVFRRDRAAGLVLVSCLALGAAIVVVQDKYFDYQWQPFRAVFAILCGVGAAPFGEMLRRRAAPRALRGLLAADLALVFALCFAYPVLYALNWAASAVGVQSWEAYYGSFGAYGKGDFSYLADREVADYLDAHTTPDDTVLVWGFEPLVNYLADRRSPTRFGFNHPLVAGAGNRWQERFRAEFLRDLEARPPTYILVVDHDQNPFMPRSSKELLADFPAFEAYLYAHYRPEGTIEHFDLWRRVEDAERQAPDSRRPNSS